MAPKLSWPARFIINDGGVIPRGFGVAWRVYDYGGCVVLPLGLNLIAAIVRALYLALRHGWEPMTERTIFMHGYLRGQQNGLNMAARDREVREKHDTDQYQRGYEAGWAASAEDMKDHFGIKP